MGKESVLKVTSNIDLLSYIINVTPELRDEIDLPKQGESTKKLGQLILDNQRYKNAFINTINVIGLTIIKRNQWNNPWEIFANKGVLKRGQQIREMIQDLAKVYDYNKNFEDKTKFLESAVPDVFSYIHEINFQKYYETTINESMLQMSFDNEETGLLDFITDSTENLYETYNYDKYLLDKYQLCRRLVNGTIRAVEIPNYANLDARKILAKMKAISNKMIFKSPNYNPAGVRRATSFDKQYLMLDAEREAINSTEVLATSYFKDEAQTRTNLALIDTFSETDEARLSELLEENYVPFTEEEKEELSKVIGVIISEDFFMDYLYALDNSTDGTKQTTFENPTTLERNIFLHVWLVLSTSPFENCCVFTESKQEITSISFNVQEATLSRGSEITLKAEVTAKGLANKGVIYEVAEGVAYVSQNGKVSIPANSEDEYVTIKATSVFDNTKTTTCKINIAENMVAAE